MTEIKKLVRSLVEDLETSGVETFSYDDDNIFSLTESNLISGSVAVYINGVLSSNVSGVTVSVDYDLCKVTVTGLSDGDEVEIRYDYYSQYSDAEIVGYIKSACVWLSVENVCDEDFEFDSGDEIYPTPSTRERRLIALVSAIVMSGSLRSYRTPDFTFTFQEDKSKEDKIRDVIWNYRSRLGIFKIIEKDAEIDGDLL